ncbi:hypothetical protein BDV06DRAFT_192257 [Aspergillus oleicola]
MGAQCRAVSIPGRRLSKPLAFGRILGACRRSCRSSAVEGADSPLTTLIVHVWHLIEGLVSLHSCQSSSALASRAPTATIAL